MSAEENKMTMRRWVEAIRSRNLAALDDVFAPTFQLAPDIPPGLEGMKQFTAAFLTSFPDFEPQIEEMLAEEDLVATRFSYRPVCRREDR